jgi:predicted DNA-binding protein with PD1-like motif
MKTLDTEQGVILRLERGDELISTLTKFCESRGINAAVFSGIGAVEKVKIGYYDLRKKEYFFRDEAGIFEVASMQGNAALVDGKPFIHAHAVLSRCDESLECIGAHIKEAFVAVTLEVHFTPLNASLSRTLDENIGLRLLDI